MYKTDLLIEAKKNRDRRLSLLIKRKKTNEIALFVRIDERKRKQRIFVSNREDK